MKTKKLSGVFIKIHTYGFTLVELIVVISILVILGTIGFMSLSGFSSSARDSSRVSDLTNISKALDITYIKSGAYPMPDSSFTVTYSGGTVWYQGTIGTTVMNTLGAAGVKFTKQLLSDPLITTNLYTYSRVAYPKDSYQLKTSWEGESVSYIPQAQAASGNPTITYIKGNYNGIAAKTQTGNTIYILAVPSIVSGTGSMGLILRIDGTNDLSGMLLVHGGTNSGGIAYNPNKIIYSSGTLPSTAADRIVFASGVASAYSGTTLATQVSIQPFITAFANNDTATLTNLGGGLLANSLGGSAGTTIVGTIPVILGYVGTTTYTSTQQFTYNGSTVTVSGTGVGTSSPGVYPSCGADIAIWSGAYVQIWAACNAGANTLYNPTIHGWSGTMVDAVEANRIIAYSGVTNSSTNFLGNYYQWGRNDQVNLIATGSTGYTGIYQTGGISIGAGSGFILGAGTNLTWIDNASHLTSSGTIWTNITNNGPCPSGYHIPTGGAPDTTTEWGIAYTIAGATSPSYAIGSCSQSVGFDRLRCALSLPLPGIRGYSDGIFYYQGSRGYYWSSSPSSTNAFYAYFYSNGGNFAIYNFRSFGFPVRCLKN